MAETMSSAAQASMCSTAGMSGETSQMATPRSITPKKALTAFIQPPALGSRAPPATPTASRGMPMPSAMANSAEPPSHTSRVWPM